MYNVPGRTGVNLSINLVEELSKLEKCCSNKRSQRKYFLMQQK
ncbi:dihydrodipicolinate synthase family protein [Fusobacterium sp. SB021]